MQYPNMFESRSKALDVAWGLYEGYNETQVRRYRSQARPRGWRLPSVMAVVSIVIPEPPYTSTLPKEYNK